MFFFFAATEKNIHWNVNLFLISFSLIWAYFLRKHALFLYAYVGVFAQNTK